MRESLPGRAFPAIVMVLGIIDLMLAYVLSGSAITFGAYTGPLMGFGLPLVILIEGLVLRRRLGLGWWGSVGVAAAVNTVSTFVCMLLLIVYVLGSAQCCGICPDWVVRRDVLHYVALLVPLFFVSWLVEYPVAWLIMLRPRRPLFPVASSEPAPAISAPQSPRLPLRSPAGLFRGTFEANSASYLFLAMILGGSLVTNILPPPPCVGQASAVGDLRTINTAEVTYSSTYTTGFSATLAGLDGNPALAASAEAAQLIDSVLGSGEKIGYRFTYRAAPDADGIIRHYTVVARPLKYRGYRGETRNSYFTDETGVIRLTNEDRDATATDRPLAG